MNAAGSIAHVEMADDHGSSLRENIDAAIAADDAVTARELIGRLWRQRPGPAVAGFVNGRLAKLTPSPNSATVAILRSFTVEPIVPILRAAAAVNGLDLSVHIGDFNTYAQEILDPHSSLYTGWAADVVILAVQTRDIAPDLWDGFAGLDSEAVNAAITRVVDQYANLIGTFRCSQPGASADPRARTPPACGSRGCRSCFGRRPGRSHRADQRRAGRRSPPRHREYTSSTTTGSLPVSDGPASSTSGSGCR